MRRPLGARTLGAAARAAAIVLLARRAGAQECDGAEPDLADANMRPMCVDECDGVEAERECGHACLEGYVGGAEPTGVGGPWPRQWSGEWQR